jgi:hypothetical protein
VPKNGTNLQSIYEYQEPQVVIVMPKPEVVRRNIYIPKHTDKYIAQIAEHFEMSVNQTINAILEADGLHGLVLTQVLIKNREKRALDEMKSQKRQKVVREWKNDVRQALSKKRKVKA